MATQRRAGRPNSLVKRTTKKYTSAEVTKLKKKFLDKLVDNKGIITRTLKECHISRYYYDRWYHTDDIFKQEILKIDEVVIDWVENKLFELIEKGDKTAIIFYLKTQAKSRGYIEQTNIKQETTYTKPITLTVTPLNPNQLESNKESNNQIELKDIKKLK